jgi:circadian clock protein KaiA
LVAPLQIYVLTHGDQAQQTPELHLDPTRYVVHQDDRFDDALSWLGNRPDPPDCLVVDDQVWHQTLRPALVKLGLVLPVVVLIGPAAADAVSPNALSMGDAEAYPGAVVHRSTEALPQMDRVIQSAIQEFLRLPNPVAPSPDPEAASGDSLTNQQHRLTEKLKARLGYLGVYYKRNAKAFLRHMPPDERADFLDQLKASYRLIILGYFAKDSKLNLNQLIDDFVDQAFMADISVAHIVEIHMELMDGFAKQLKLEGRSEEILLDYRLTLIDVIAHLCEMYRRSIPREP